MLEKGWGGVEGGGEVPKERVGSGWGVAGCNPLNSPFGTVLDKTSGYGFCSVLIFLFLILIIMDVLLSCG